MEDLNLCDLDGLGCAAGAIARGRVGQERHWRC